MTGKDLIIYILKNDLEDKPVVEDGKFIGFLTDEEVAVKLQVGVATIQTMVKLGVLPGVKIGGILYIFGDYETHLRGEYEKENY